MTNKTTEALKLAEALENDAKEHREVSYGLDCPPERTANWKHALNCEDAARLIREALAEPVKQKPVAWMVIGDGQHGVYKAGEHFDSIECSSYWNNRGYELVPVYAAPVSAKREWVDLTEGEQEAIYLKCNTPSEYTNAVIAAFKEKNR